MSSRPRLMPRGRCSGCGQMEPLPPFAEGMCFLCATDGPPGKREPTGSALHEDKDARRTYEGPSEAEEENQNEIVALFEEASSLGRRFRVASIAFGADVDTKIRVVGAMPMPWEREGFEVWCAKEVERLEKEFARLRAIREMEEADRPKRVHKTRRKRGPLRVMRPSLPGIDAKWNAVILKLRDEAARVQAEVEMNRLSLEKRNKIVEMKEAGATIREIAAAVGCSVPTVIHYTPGSYRRRVLGLIAKVFDELKAKGIDGTDIEALVNLHCEIGWTCPIHPEAVPNVDISAESDCKLCEHRGRVRHHERRKAEGRPILPPWAIKRAANAGKE
ncbi:MAG: helix-turn-helix domain-containing protein [Polyangiales bacterium]